MWLWSHLTGKYCLRLTPMIDDYAKVIGYAGIYASLYSVCMTDITITIVIAKYPRKLVKYLKEKRGLAVVDKGNGIHYIEDAFPVQILETKKLKNIFLRNLRSNLTPIELKETLQALEKAGVTNKRDVYLERLLSANWNTFREVINMMPALKELFLATAEEDGWLEEWGQKREIKKAREIAKGLKQDNAPLSMIVKNTGFTLQEVEAL